MPCLRGSDCSDCRRTKRGLPGERVSQGGMVRQGRSHSGGGCHTTLGCCRQRHGRRDSATVVVRRRWWVWGQLGRASKPWSGNLRFLSQQSCRWTGCRDVREYALTPTGTDGCTRAGPIPGACHVLNYVGV